MRPYTYNNYQLILKKMKKKKFYRVLIIKGYTNKVIEKIGTFDHENKKFILNNFRFLYWISKNIKVHWKFFYLLNFFGLSHKINEIGK